MKSLIASLLLAAFCLSAVGGLAASKSVDSHQKKEGPSEETSADTSIPPDYRQYEEACEYTEGRRITSILRRWVAIKLGTTEAYVENPAGLDERRERILDAIWNEDEELFLELAASPTTGEVRLLNQTFQEIFRMFKRYRDEGFRTLRHHPLDPVETDEGSNIWCRHQWMTLPENTKRTPERGNLLMIFDPEDLRLRVVRFNPFSKSNDVNVLPYPNEAIPNDPVRDRPAIMED